MKTLEVQSLRVDPHWKDHGGAIFVIAHPDDEILIGWGLIQVFVDAGIPVSVLALSLGEKGKVDGNALPSQEVRAIRHKEFMCATEALGVKGIVAEPEFPDSEFGMHRSEIDELVTQYVRDGAYDVIVSFAPSEHTYRFDHEDHHVVSHAACLASEKADMPSVYPDYGKALTFRPSLLGWTTNPSIGAHPQLYQLPLSDSAIAQRSDILSTHYASQFPKRSKDMWEPVFAQISRGDSDASCRQMYFQIR